MTIASFRPGDACNILNYDYAELSKYSYEKAVEIIARQPHPGIKPCLNNVDARMQYVLDGESIVQEVFGNMQCLIFSQ